MYNTHTQLYIKHLSQYFNHMGSKAFEMGAQRSFTIRLPFPTLNFPSGLLFPDGGPRKHSRCVYSSVNTRDLLDTVQTLSRDLNVCFLRFQPISQTVLWPVSFNYHLCPYCSLFLSFRGPVIQQHYKNQNGRKFYCTRPLETHKGHESLCLS